MSRLIGTLDLLEDPAQDHFNDPSDNRHHKAGRLLGESTCSRTILYEGTAKRLSARHRRRIVWVTRPESSTTSTGPR